MNIDIVYSCSSVYNVFLPFILERDYTVMLLEFFIELKLHHNTKIGNQIESVVEKSASDERAVKKSLPGYLE